MKRFIRFIFGKPYEKGIFKFFYWFAAIFYFIAIFNLVVITILTQDIWIAVMNTFSIIMFPLIFRLVYFIATKLHETLNG